MLSLSVDLKLMFKYQCCKYCICICLVSRIFKRISEFRQNYSERQKRKTFSIVFPFGDCTIEPTNERCMCWCITLFSVNFGMNFIEINWTIRTIHSVESILAYFKLTLQLHSSPSTVLKYFDHSLCVIRIANV